MSDIVIIPTNAHMDMAREIVCYSRKFHPQEFDIFDITESTFANNETNIKFNESIRGKNAYIVSTGAGDINTNFLSSLFISRACKRSAAKSITMIYGAFPYARSDKKDHRGTIGASDIASMIEDAGVNRVITFDLHSGQIQGFFHKIPCDNIYCIKELSKKLKEYNTMNMVLCSPDAGGVKRVEAWANIMKMDYVIMHKKRDYSKPNTIASTKLIGDPDSIKNKTLVLIDDMADTMGTMCATINELSQYNIKDCIVIVTHGYFSGEALERINMNPLISKVICTDTISQKENILRCPKIEVVGLAPLISEIIKRIEVSPTESISELFS